MRRGPEKHTNAVTGETAELREKPGRPKSDRHPFSGLNIPPSLAEGRSGGLLDSSPALRLAGRDWLFALEGEDGRVVAG